MSPGLRIPPGLAGRMDAHLRASYPEEGCGLLIGREHADRRDVLDVLPFENRHDETRERRFLIAPEQFLAGEKAARAAGLDVIGIFHSHPDHPCRPSAFDLEHAWPYYSYVIVSVERGRVVETRSWRLREDRSGFDEETIELVPPAGAGEGAS